MTVQMRTARTTDIPALLVLQHAAWLADYRAVIPAGYAEPAMRMYGTTAAVQRQIERDNRYLVVEDAGTVVAGATAEVLSVDEAELWWIHTTKSHRGRGIGRQLVNAITQQLMGHVPTLCVTTFQGYTPTLTFYAHLGFRVQKTYSYATQGFEIPEVRLWRPI